MSNLTSSIILFILGIVTIVALYFLVAKWGKFLISTLGKIFKSIMGLLAVILLGGFFTSAYYNFDDYYRNDRLKLETELEGFQIGWSKDELYFKKGKPLEEKTTAEEKAELLTYSNNTDINIKNGKIGRVSLFCENSDYGKGVGNIYCHDNIEKIITKYGDTDIISTSKDKLSRIYSYPKYNVAFILEKGVVLIIVVFDPQLFPKGIEFRE